MAHMQKKFCLYENDKNDNDENENENQNDENETDKIEKYQKVKDYCH